MRKFILSILVTLLWPVMAHATVIEFNGDGTVTTYEARDYLAEDRRSRKKPEVSFLTSKQEPKGTFNDLIRAAARKYSIDSKIIHAVVETESFYRPNALSAKGAQGLMQLMPDTAKQLGVIDAFDPAQNIEGGTKHLKYLLDKYDGELSLALAAYNAGEGTVNKYGGIPPYSETRQYIEKIERLIELSSQN
jgi:soluble lytic murein transglycosylase-like protein